MIQELHSCRDDVLNRAAIKPGDVVLDVGCGDGLIGFGALERIGLRGQVIFSDISTDLIARCTAIAQKLGVIDRCRFLVNPAEDLHQVADGCVDVVTTRSVLIYVNRKDRAFAEFFRVLRPGGRISLAEPINRFACPEPKGVFMGYDVTAVVELADRLEAFLEREERPRIMAMMDFDERDLVALAEHTGFDTIHLDYMVDVKPTQPQDWDRFLRTAGNPLSPTMEEALTAALDPADRERFTRHLRPLVEAGAGTDRRAFAYLSARKSAV